MTTMRSDRRTLLRGLAAAAGGAVLSACSQTSEIVEGLLGEKDVRLPGKREDIFATSGARVSDEPVVVPPEVRNTSWAQPGGRASNANHNLALGRPIRKAFSVSAGVGSDSDGSLSAPPVVIGGRIFVLDAKGNVTGMSAASGKRLWRTSLVPKGEDADVGFGGGLCSDGAALYAATGFGEVVALDPATGRVLWRQKLEMPFRTAPVVASGRIYVRDLGNTLYCLSAAGGAEQWRQQGDRARASIISASAPAVGEGVVVAPFSTGDVAAFTPGGATLWSENIGAPDAISDIAGRPVIYKGLVHVIPAAGSFTTFRLRSGQEVWSLRTGGRNTPWLAGDYLFVITGKKRLSAVNRRTGGVRWTVTMPEGAWSGPVMGGGRLLAVSSKGVLAEFSPQTGQLMNKHDIGEKAFIAPVIANATLYVLANDGSLIAFR